jgi:O-acetyl-ADP-ribose deacetylase (regulator of RNase III)
MIEFSSGNILASEVEALVNTENTVGVMGKGVALQFKQAFPANYKAYRVACKGEKVELGRMFVWDSGHLGLQRYIINFPTKKHWRTKSRLADIQTGLDDLVRIISELDIQSIALPALGCGNGGLDWDEVRPLIEDKLGPLPVRAIVYPPAGPPAAREMPVATKKPPMTFGRAALLALVGRYSQAAMRERFDLIRPGASLLEIQKLMYLLQETGQLLRLGYTKGRYGPHAESLNKVLEGMEGHFIRGYGDRSGAVMDLDPIEVLPAGEAEAKKWLLSRPDVQRDVDRVLHLVNGWESAYGLELLGTLLFAARTDEKVIKEVDRAEVYVHSWNKRKQATFPRNHILLAWQHLQSFEWLRSDESSTNSTKGATKRP